VAFTATNVSIETGAERFGAVGGYLHLLFEKWKRSPQSWLENEIWAGIGKQNLWHWAGGA
jgi:hypothetical protein